MSPLLDIPWHVNRRAECLYVYAPGEVCVDLTSGTPENRARVMALLEQVQRMAQLLSKHLAGYGGHNCHTTPPECDVCGPIEECLRDAGLLSDDAVPSEGT